MNKIELLFLFCESINLKNTGLFIILLQIVRVILNFAIQALVLRNAICATMKNRIWFSANNN